MRRVIVPGLGQDLLGGADGGDAVAAHPHRGVAQRGDAVQDAGVDHRAAGQDGRGHDGSFLSSARRAGRTSPPSFSTASRRSGPSGGRTTGGWRPPPAARRQRSTTSAVLPVMPSDSMRSSTSRRGGVQAVALQDGRDRREVLDRETGPARAGTARTTARSRRSWRPWRAGPGSSSPPVDTQKQAGMSRSSTGRPASSALLGHLTPRGGEVFGRIEQRQHAVGQPPGHLEHLGAHRADVHGHRIARRQPQLRQGAEPLRQLTALVLGAEQGPQHGDRLGGPRQRARALDPGPAEELGRPGGHPQQEPAAGGLRMVAAIMAISETCTE